MHNLVPESSKQKWIQEHKLIQVGEMVAMIAHQWRQPLNALSASAINLSLKAQLGNIDVTSVEKEALFIQKQCQKLSQTIESFMDFVKPRQEERRFSLRHAVEQSLLLVERQLYNRDISVIIDEEIIGAEIFGYEDQFEQVFLNLISNARDAFEVSDKKEKKLIVSIKQDSFSQIIFSIEDNAGGISEAIRDKIFDPYFTSKQDGKGTGLGLYMSLEIIRKSFNGDLVYIPTEFGSRFEICFNKSVQTDLDIPTCNLCKSLSKDFYTSLTNALQIGALSRAERLIDTLENDDCKEWLIQKLSRIDFMSIFRLGEYYVRG